MRNKNLKSEGDAHKLGLGLYHDICYALSEFYIHIPNIYCKKIPNFMIQKEYHPTLNDTNQNRRIMTCDWFNLICFHSMYS